MIKTVYLVAGAGGMYCGTCLRDNRLAATMIRQGRDVVLVPLYTPIRTDEPDVSERTVHFGGINVYLQQKSSLVRRFPRILTRLLDSRAILNIAGRLFSGTRAETLGDLTVSLLQGPSGHQQLALQKLIDGLRELRPRIVHLPNLMFSGIAGALKEALSVTIVCSLAGEDVFLEALPQPFRDQSMDLIRQGAGAIDAFVAPTNYYGAFSTRHFGLSASRVYVVPMGISTEGIPKRSPHNDQPPTIGYLARICPEKGLAELAEAFALLLKRNPNCRLRIAGYLDPADRPYWRSIREKLTDRGIFDSVDFVGEVSRSEKWAFLQSLDLLSVPTVYHESKGLYVLESLACGTPVVLPRQGSFTELVEDTRGGVLYEPTGPATLSAAIESLLADPDRRRDLAQRGRLAVLDRYNDDLMARRTWALYEQLVG